MFESYEHLKFERDGGILTIIIDNPPLNAMTAGIHRELGRIFLDVNRDETTRVVVLTGVGDRAFSAGGDLNRMIARFEAQDVEAWAERAEEAKAIVYGLLQLTKPLIGRINGHAMGLGATLAAFCDFAFMMKDARIADTHVNIGLAAGDGGALIWPLLLGFSRAKLHLLTGMALTGAEAAEVGLVESAFDTIEELDAAVVSRANLLKSGAPIAIQNTKAAINLLQKNLLEGLVNQHMALETQTVLTADHYEAITAFRDGREPNFTGR